MQSCGVKLTRMTLPQHRIVQRANWNIRIGLQRNVLANKRMKLGRHVGFARYEGLAGGQGSFVGCCSLFNKCRDRC